MLIRTISLAMLIALVGTGPGHTCTDGPSCAQPASGALPAGAVTGGSFDAVYLDDWQYSQQTLNALWGGLECERCDWDEGWGYADPTNLNLTLSRLLNGAAVLLRLEGYTRYPGFGLWRPINGIPEARFSQGQWWQFASVHGSDEWVPGCGGVGSLARHYQGTDEYNELFPGGAYTIAAVQRASTIVHETTHQDVGHEDADDCNPSTASCDPVYGAYGSNTMQVNMLHDAVTAFQATWDGNQPLHRVAVSGDSCRWLPLFSQVERTAATARANAVMNRFARDAYPGWRGVLTAQVAARQAEGEWACAACDPAAFEFRLGANQCPVGGCDERLNPQNAVVNQQNRADCLAYNAARATDGGSRATTARARQALTSRRRPCLPPAPGYGDDYCATERATATSVRQIDECGLLDTVSSVSITKLECVQRWCADTYAATPFGRTDPFGCVDYICGQSGPCGDSPDAATCADMFFMAHGDPEYYVPACQYDACKATRATCLLARFRQGTWAYGQPIPASCETEKRRCERAFRYAIELLVNHELLIDRDPLNGGDDDIPDFSNPGRRLRAVAEELRAAVASQQYTEEQLDGLTRKVAQTPELIAGLYARMPGEFVSVLGREGFAEIVGPSVDRITATPIDPSALTAAGQSALSALNEVLQDNPGGIRTAVGFLRP